MKTHIRAANRLLSALAGAAVACTAAAAPPTAEPVLDIDYFYEPGCAECQRVNTEVLPALTDRYAGLFRLRAWDVGVASNYTSLVAWMDRLGIEANAHVFMVVGGRRMLAGADAIAENLFALLDEEISLGAPAPPPPPAAARTAEPGAFLRERATRFTAGQVMLGGLVDGINPCAISTLVFLLSVLSLSRLPRRSLLVVGAVYCTASFLTYLAIGFGLLHMLHRLSLFPAIRKAVDWTLVGLLLVFAAYSFVDALRFHRTGEAGDVRLQLPDRVKRLIHRIMRDQRDKGWHLAPVFLMGAAVTALESVCTGQVYVPTLAFAVKSGGNVVRSLGYLLLYNLMFILPLVIVFTLTYHGLKLTRLAEWSRRNVVSAKILMGVFFLLLAAAMLALM